MKVGDYVRTYDGIGKVVETRIFLRTEEFRLDSGVGNITQIPDNTKWNDNRNVIKSAEGTPRGLLNLIEVGDYVNGYLVIERDINNELRYIDLKDRNMKYVKNLDIKSIVTHEQFSQMEYRIGE